MDTSITSFHHGGMRPSVFWELHSITQFLTDVYRCAAHLDNITIPFYQQMHLLLNIQNVKIYIKISYIRSYMFRSTWTILRELTLSLAKVTLL
jgi:hypothetical protein